MMLKNWKIWRHQNIFQKTECETSLDNNKKMEKLYFPWQMVHQTHHEETTNSKNTIWDGNPPWGERTSAENLMATGKSFNLKKQNDEGIKKNFWAHAEARKEFHLSSSCGTESSSARAEKRIISNSIELYWCHQVNLCRSGGCTRKANLWSFRCQKEQKSVRFVDEFHKIYVIERNTSKGF